jgi:hypothetical protein
MNMSAENALASNHASAGHEDKHDASAASATQAKLAPPQLLASARDTLLESTSQWATQAQALGATAQTRANDLTRATRDQAGYQTQHLRAWFERTRSQYPWLPAALIGGVCGILAGLAILGWLGMRSSN